MEREGKRWFKKIVMALVVTFTVMTITFFLMHTIDGDPFLSSIENASMEARQAYVERYGLDKTIVTQYFIFLKRLFVYGDLGVSLVNRTSSVNDVLRHSMKSSVILGMISVALGTTIGCLLGTIAAYVRNNTVRNIISVVCIAGISLPIYVWAPVLQDFFGCKLHLLPVSGYGTARHMILPVICMMPSTIVSTMKYTRNSVGKIRNSDYYIALKQRGLREGVVFFHHIVKNAMPSIITILVSSLSGVFTGAFIVEKIYAIPGIGRQFMLAINMRDYSILIGLNIVFTLIYITFRMVGDFIQELCNPQFREG